MNDPARDDAFGVYLHIPFCARRCDYCAFATWTDREPPGRRLPGGVSCRHRAGCRRWPAAGDERVRRRRHAVAGARTPRSSTCSAPAPRAGRRDHRRVQPRHRHRRTARHLRGGRRQPPVVRRAVDGAPRARRAGAHPRPRQRPTRRRRGPASRLRELQPRRHLRRRRRVARRLAPHTIEEILALDPPHVSAYGLTVEAGTPLADDPDRHPVDDDQADKYLLADGRLRRGRARLVRDLQLGATRPRVPPQPPLLVARATTSGFGCAAHSHRQGRRWWNVRTPERYVAAVDAAAIDRGRRRRPRRRHPRRRAAAARAADGVTACPLDALDGDDLPGLVDATRRPLGAHA